MTGQPERAAFPELQEQCGQIAYNLGHVLLGRGFLMPGEGGGWYIQEFSDPEKRQLPYEVWGAEVNQIARELFISVSTSRIHRSSIYGKVGVSGKRRGFLPRRLIELGVIPVPELGRLPSESELRPREQQALERASYGDSNAEIAAALSVNKSGKCLSGMLKKLHASNRVEAVYKGFGYGLLTPDYQPAKQVGEADLPRAHALLQEAWGILMNAPVSGPTPQV